MAPVMAGDTRAVAAHGGAPLPACVAVGEEEKAVGCQAGTQVIAVRPGEEFDGLARDDLYGKLGLAPVTAIHA